MKRLFALLTALALVLALAACGGNAPAADTGSESAVPSETDGETDAAESGPETQTDAQTDGHRSVLVVVFSATGTTKGVAEKIAAIENADLYEIRAAQAYTDADLNWHDSGSRTTLEQNDKSARPEIAGEKISLGGYEKIYIGFPIWWGEEPRIMDTFAESYDFTGVTLIPFCTSSSSGIGRSGQNLAELAGSGSWLEGKRFGGSVSEADLQSWIDSLK